MAQLSQLLLFDPDPSGSDTLTYGFEKDGCSVTSTADPAKARHLAEGGSPSLMLVHLRAGPKGGAGQQQLGLELIRGITTNPRTRNLSCVAIGPDQSRGAALAAGAYSFLSVPLFVRDVISVCKMVAAAAVAGSRPAPDAELTLALQDVDGIYFLVRALAVTGRAAVIEARHGHRRGELRFMDGTLTSVVAGAVQGLPALHQMLLWEDGELHFKFKNVVRRGTQLSMKSSGVLEECDVFLRDFAHEAKEVGVARTIYSAEHTRVQPSSALPSEVVPILRLFDGRRDLAQVLDESPFRIFDTLKIIKRFATDGAIQLKTPLPGARADLGRAVSGPAALDHWLQKPAPPLGLQVGENNAPNHGVTRDGTNLPRQANGVGIPTVRGQSSFPTMAAGVATAATKNEGAGVPSVTGAPTVTKKIVARKTVTKKTIGGPAAPSPEDMITPPPRPPRSITPQKATPALVVRGEITVMPVAKSRMQGVQTTGHESSVVVDLGDLPDPQPMSSPTAPPVSAQTRGPSVIVETMISPRVSAPPALPAVIVAPLTPAPLPLSPAPPAALALASEAPPAVPGLALSMDRGRPERGHSESFNDVESDFFEREADLYKRESVETFDDLDSHFGVPRKR